MQKRILIPRVRLNEAYEGNKDERRLHGLSRFDNEFGGNDSEYDEIGNMYDDTEKNDRQIDIRDTKAHIEAFLNRKFGGVKFKVVERANESVLSADQVDLIIVPEVKDPLNITYVIDDIDKEIVDNKVILDRSINPVKLWPLVIAAAKEMDANAPDYVKAIHKVS